MIVSSITNQSAGDKRRSRITLADTHEADDLESLGCPIGAPEVLIRRGSKVRNWSIEHCRDFFERGKRWAVLAVL